MIVSKPVITCMSKLIYLSGPMRGEPDLNFKAFNDAAADLRSRGFEVINPAEQDEKAGFPAEKNRPWLDCIVEDAKAVLAADYIVLLKGWQMSAGVRAEIAIREGALGAGEQPYLEYHGRNTAFKSIPDPMAEIQAIKDYLAAGTMADRARTDEFEKAKKWVYFTAGLPTGIVADVIKDGSKHPGEVIHHNGPRVFESGATRNADTGKPDYEGFLSPLVMEAFGEYMHEHRHLENGELRASDNWQKGIPMDAYMKSAWRHFVHLWTLHRGLSARDEKGKAVTMRSTLAALMFNVQGYFHEWLKKQPEGVREQVFIMTPVRTPGPDQGFFPITAEAIPAKRVGKPS